MSGPLKGLWMVTVNMAGNSMIIVMHRKVFLQVSHQSICKGSASMCNNKTAYKSPRKIMK